MTRKRQRMIFVVTGLISLGVATGLVLLALGDNLVFFHGPARWYLKNSHPSDDSV